jgi:hypothetical protein
MVRILAQFDHIIGNRLYNFICPPDAPPAEAKEAALEFVKHITLIEEQNKAANESALEAAKTAQSASPVSETHVEEIKG